MELETIFRVLVQKWHIVLPIFIITVIASVIFTRNQPVIYEAKATYVAKLNPDITDNRDFAAIINTLSSRVEIPTTYAEVANSRRLYGLASQKLGLSPEMTRNLTVESRLIAGTNIIEIAVRGTTPVLARDFANAIGESTIEYAQNLYGTFMLDTLDEATTPRNPIQPKPVLNLTLGSILGLTLGIFVAILIHFYRTPTGQAQVVPDNRASPEPSSTYNLPMARLQEDLNLIQAQFEDTRRELDQIQTALRRTNSYARDIRSVVHDLEAHFDGNHSPGNNGTGE